MKEQPEQPNALFDVEKLDVLAHLIRSDIRVVEHKSGWFSGIEKCASGFDILNWIKDHAEQNEKKASDICQKMLDQEVITRIDGNQLRVFESAPHTLYKFYEDRDDIADNMLRPWKGEVKSNKYALEVSAELVQMIEEIYMACIVETEDEPEIHPEKGLQSQTYESYIEKVSVLEKVDLMALNSEEIFCFFLNVYQCMYIHKFLKSINQVESRNEPGILQKIAAAVWNTGEKEFFYQIGDQTYTLEQLKHGVLRGNRKKPGAIFRMFGNNDPRSWFDGRLDQRILFLCIDIPDVPEHIECFDSPDTINEKLNGFLKMYFEQKIEVDTMNEEITLPKVIETYKSDFGSEEDILRFVWNWYENYEFDIEQIVKVVKRKQLMIKYDQY